GSLALASGEPPGALARLGVLAPNQEGPGEPRVELEGERETRAGRLGGEEVPLGGIEGAAHELGPAALGEGRGGQRVIGLDARPEAIQRADRGARVPAAEQGHAAPEGD